MHDDDAPTPRGERHGLDGDKEKQCGNCRYFAPYGNGDGDCRRHAPAPSTVRLHNSRDDDTVAMQGWWPTVDEIDWCGEFEAIDASDW